MRPAVFVVLALLSASSVAAQTGDRWEKDIAAFEAADKMSAPQKGGIVFVGSSTIRRWDTASYFPDLKIINRGFGGSNMVAVDGDGSFAAAGDHRRGGGAFVALSDGSVRPA